MKIYIWEQKDNITDRYHSGGGLLVIAESKAQAIEMIESKKEGAVRDYVDIEIAEDFTFEDPDYEFEIEASEPKIIVFPNTGCC